MRNMPLPVCKEWGFWELSEPRKIGYLFEKYIHIYFLKPYFMS